MTPEFLWRLCVQADGGVQRKFSLHLLLFKCLQLKIVNTPKWHILGWHVLNSCSLVLGWRVLLPFSADYLYVRSTVLELGLLWPFSASSL